MSAVRCQWPRTLTPVSRPFPTTSISAKSESTCRVEGTGLRAHLERVSGSPHDQWPWRLRAPRRAQQASAPVQDGAQARPERLNSILTNRQGKGDFLFWDASPAPGRLDAIMSFIMLEKGIFFGDQGRPFANYFAYLLPPDFQFLRQILFSLLA
jgi:hypothetical protein